MKLNKKTGPLIYPESHKLGIQNKDNKELLSLQILILKDLIVMKLY